jgi:uroporphyrinogen decarboxylase
LPAKNITHRERMENCVVGEPTDKTPIALWRHFPVDDQSPESLASAIINFQQAYNFDLVKVTPASSYCLKDWGVVDEWQGNPEGTRQYTQRVIRSAEDWYKLPALDPNQGFLGAQLTCLKTICDELGPSVPVIQTIFSPLAQAKNLVGGEMLLVHLRQHPEAVLEGLKTITETTKRFIEAANKTGMAGIFYAVQQASFRILSEAEYLQLGHRFDLEILAMSSQNWLNMLHLHGNDIMFHLFTEYPVQVINWHDRETFPSLAKGKQLFPGVVCGGLQRERTMELGTPEEVEAEAKEAISTTENKRFILGTGCVLQTTTPRANILAAIKAARGE